MANYTMMQFFEWYYPADGSLWNHLKAEAEHLKKIGIDTVWIPPAYKGMNGNQSNGYDAYDLYDLGEFDQKGSIATKYGTKQELIDAVAAAQNAGLQVYADIVFNHRGGADETEIFIVRKVNPADRNEFISEPYEIEGYTKFTFPGRKGKYSKFIWDFHCFSGLDFDARAHENAIFSIQNQYGEGWQDVLSDENGNYDFLMHTDVDLRNPSVREELKRWGKWFIETVGINGFRLDAIKHIDPKFFDEWLDYLRAELGHEFFTVGEYWDPYDLGSLLAYIGATDGRMSLFDAPLQGNFHKASKEGNRYDLRTIFDNSLVAVNPALAVTLVENHDTQPLQSLEQPVMEWFRPLAYALILLREGGYPCVFYTDLYGSTYSGKGSDGKKYNVKLKITDELEALLHLRKHRAYGLQRDYFDHPNCIGWTRTGDQEHANSGCAVLISNSESGNKRMEMGKPFAAKVFIDYLRHVEEEVTVGHDGFGDFKVAAGSVSVWVLKG
ncbi:alpha-amylase [Daejeonella oryzae]|uniref:alpha-amylase n=1 Tax=Daejeonella oryzae TaxID=1122943 RepID=UPI00040CAB46|nr:alpha-amylase [Daejeonella oryzae]